MEVLYTSEGRKPVHVGVRIPYEDESIEEVIFNFCPTGYWESLEKTIQHVEQGTKGTLSLSDSKQFSVVTQSNDDVGIKLFGNVDGSIPIEEIK